MRRILPCLSLFSVTFGALGLAAGVALAASPTVEQALRLSPLQSEIDYDQPEKLEAARCTIKPAAGNGISGWVIRDNDGQVLRRFLDTNNDNKVDRWCYYKNNVEVYRDADTDFNGKADRYRWLGTAGMRSGLDRDENGTIDSWESISAEEVSSEVVAALRAKDSARFGRLLLTKAELQSLGLGKDKAETLAERVANAGTKFSTVARRQSIVSSDSRWLHFGASRPGIVPAGTDGSMKDVMVYENVIAVVESAGKHSQLHIGTLVQVDRKWRLVDLPGDVEQAQADASGAGFFFQASVARRLESAEGTTSGGLDPEIQKLILELEKADKALASATTPLQTSRANADRADLIEKLADKATTETERLTWLRQLADTVSAAVQSGGYVGGTKRLRDLYQKVSAKEPKSDIAGYVKFRSLSAEYAQSLSVEKADYAKIQEKWLKDLQAFVTVYPKTPDAAEAMLQLAIADEFAGHESDALRWYGRIVRTFPTATVSKKAEGAMRRLNSVGKVLSFEGTATTGKRVDLASFRGKVVVLHYWATWCGPCKEDMKELAKLRSKYGAKGFAVVGVNLDTQRSALDAHLRTSPLPWPQLFEEGGLDSPLATQLGVLTLPTMLLIDKEGRVANRGIYVNQLEAELKQRLK